jgi:hypothetical protein
MTHDDVDPNLLEDMEIAVVARERIAAGGATSMDDIFRRYGIPIDLSDSNSSSILDPFKIGES